MNEQFGLLFTKKGFNFVNFHYVNNGEPNFLGAIFTQDQKDSSTELAFKYAVYRINKDKHLLPETTLVYDIQYAPKDDSFHASKKGIYVVRHSKKR